MGQRNRWLWQALIIVAALTASSAVVGGGSSGIQALDAARVRTDGVVLFRGVTVDWNNPDSCVRSDWVALSPLHAYYREIYAAMLAAYATAKEVSFWLSGCVEASGDTYPEISSITVR
jgi:hypothetical protein